MGRTGSAEGVAPPREPAAGEAAPTSTITSAPPRAVDATGEHAVDASDEHAIDADATDAGAADDHAADAGAPDDHAAAPVATLSVLAPPPPAATVTADVRPASKRGTPRPAPGAPSPAAAPARAFDADWSERGRYALVEEIARGGGGRIAVAVDRKLGRRVALKRPLDRDGEERLEREALVLARLEHPAIVPIHDAGHDGEGSPFYTMKLLGGQTLAARLAAARDFDARLGLLAAVTSVADAMAYAHSQRVIHRDLKPGNVLVGEFGEVALIDWGLGKVLGDADVTTTSQAGAAPALTRADLTGHGAVVGTPAYMAPEQAAGEEVDERADVYALGAMLYHVLSGEVPYGRLTTAETLVRLVDGPPPPLAEREPRVPDDLAALVAKAMARAPADRYPTARELAEDLHRYQTGRLVAAHRYRLHTRAWRWIRRHQVAVTAAVAATAIGVAGVAILRARAAAIDPCAGIDAPALAAWSPRARAAAERAFTASGVAYAAAAFRAVDGALDGRVHRLGAMRVEACRAARVTREQSTDVMELRLRCLERQTAELTRFTASLGQADAGMVTRARQAEGQLGRVEDCADVERLRDQVPLPDQPALRAAIVGVEAELDHLQDLTFRGDYVGQLGRAPAAATQALATGYAPVVARALIRWAGLCADGSFDDAALALYRAALTASDRAHDDVSRGRALDGLIRIEADHRGHFDAAVPYAEQALAVAERTGSAELASEVDIYLAHIAAAQDRPADALAYNQRALARLADAPPSDGMRERAQFDLGTTLIEQKRYAEGEAMLKQVVDQLRTDFGTQDHPDVARALANMAAAEYLSGDAKQALVYERQADAIYARTLPALSHDILDSRRNVAEIEERAGLNVEAERDLRALLPDVEGKMGHDDAFSADVVIQLGDAVEAQGRVAEALALYHDGRARLEHSKPRSQAMVICLADIGGAEVERGHPKDAIAPLDAALALAGELGDQVDELQVAYAHAERGRALVDLGQPRAAADELGGALTVIDAEGDPLERGMYRTALAQARWALGDHAGADAVAAEARGFFDQDPDATRSQRAELDHWLATRR